MASETLELQETGNGMGVRSSSSKDTYFWLITIDNQGRLQLDSGLTQNTTNFRTVEGGDKIDLD